MGAYSKGTLVLAASCDRRIVIGADKVYTDKSTVAAVQRKLHALALATGNSDFDPYSDGYKDDGVLGSRTQLSLIAFNQAFGWPSDNNTITDGTLEALKRPDVVDPKGYAARQAAYAAGQAQTVEQVQDAAAKLVALAPPAARAKAQQAVDMAMSATTPAEVEQAKGHLKEASELVKTSRVDVSGSGVEWGPLLLAAGGILGLGVVGWAVVTR